MQVGRNSRSCGGARGGIPRLRPRAGRRGGGNPCRRCIDFYTTTILLPPPPPAPTTAAATTATTTTTTLPPPVSSGYSLRAAAAVSYCANAAAAALLRVRPILGSENSISQPSTSTTPHSTRTDFTRPHLPITTFTIIGRHPLLMNRRPSSFAV